MKIICSYNSNNSLKYKKYFSYNLLLTRYLKKYLLFSIIIVISSLVVISCKMIDTQPKKLICPIPEQNCHPGEWRGMVYDTSEATTKFMKEYYKFEALKQTNSPVDEWVLSFINDHKAILTFSDADIQKSMIVRMVGCNQTAPESGILIPIEGHYGSFSIKDNKVILAAESFDDILGNSNLYEANLDGNQLKNIKELGANVHFDKFTWESQPALSPDGNVLFFASDRPEGLGGTDIWFTVKMDNGEWSQPINCGESVNSKCDDITPFVTSNGKQLYFSSAGHETVGGYDIFVCEINDSFWRFASRKDIDALKTGQNYFNVAKNLRPPLNTIYDEIFPSSPGDSDSLLYYSSNQRSGGALVLMQGGFDIFIREKIVKEVLDADKSRNLAKAGTPDVQGEIPINVKNPENITFSNKVIVEGTIINNSTKLPVPKADIEVKELPNLNIAATTTSDNKGKYKVELDKGKEFEITAQAKDLFYDTFKVRVESSDTLSDITHDFKLPEILTLRVNFPNDKFKTPYKYTLDSNACETVVTWEEELDILAKNIIDSKDIIEKIILIGHTDDVGADEYNITLGQKRVDFITSELIKRGVPAEILFGHSDGKRSLLLKRDNEDIKIYRKRLRRVELQKIMKK